jgi:intein-encoded DNA endonuclease-like protein
VDEKRNEVQVYQKNLGWLAFVNLKMKDAFGVEGKIFKRDVYLLRKRNKQMVQKLRELKVQSGSFSLSFVAGLFDSEGSVYLSTKSKIPVIDITQSSKGLEYLEIAKRILEARGIECKLNGPYAHKRAKLPQYHLRIYGTNKCKKFLDIVPIFYADKFERHHLSGD